MNVEQLLKNNEAFIVDVRTPGEFMGGHVKGSVNIPLQELMGRREELVAKAGGKPIVLCCASGNRSGQAEMLLRAAGINDCYNGGSWVNVNYYCNN